MVKAAEHRSDETDDGPAGEAITPATAPAAGSLSSVFEDQFDGEWDRLAPCLTRC